MNYWPLFFILPFFFLFFLFFWVGGDGFCILIYIYLLADRKFACFDSLLRGVNHTHMWSVRLFIFLIFNVFIYKFKL